MISGVRRMSSIRDVIIHYHLFKNAGSTLAAALRRQFGSRFAQVDAFQPGGRFSAEQLQRLLWKDPRLAAISSHTLWPPLPVTDQICFHEILILRHPLDRIRSMYDFYRRSEMGSHPFSEIAKQLQIGSFIRELMHGYPHIINNAQLRIICGGERKPKLGDLETGLALLKKASVTGTVEAYDESLATGEYELRRIFPELDLSYVAKNVSVRAASLQERLAQFHTACGADLYAQLTSLNELDFELVCAARQELARRFNQLAKREEILRNFRHRVWWRVQVQYFQDRFDWAQDFLRRRRKQLFASKVELTKLLR